MGDIVTMFDKRLYKAWDKLSVSLKTNKPIAEKEGGDAEAMFNQSRSTLNQLNKYKNSLMQCLVLVLVLL